MKKTNTTMKKTIAIMMMIATLVSLVACGAAETGGATGDATDNTAEQMQATGNVPTSEGDKQGETTTGQTGEPASSTSEAADPSTQASTEPGTDKTEPSTQPSESQPTEPSTQPTQPTTPTQPQPTDPPHQHSYTTTVVAPTCNDKGYTKHTCSCGDSYKDNYTDALGHHFIDEVVAPTSTEQGYTKHTCDRCWYSYNDNYTDPVKMIYDVAQAQQIGNNYIASLGYTVDESLVWDTHGYYPPYVSSGYSIGLVGGQEWLNNSAIEKVDSTVNRLIATEPSGDITGVRLFCSVTYDSSTDKYTICIYYG